MNQPASPASIEPRPGGAAAWFEIIRPFSLTASLIPTLVALGTAILEGGAYLVVFPLVLIGSLAMQAGTNVTNEVYDVQTGVDTIDTPRASRALIEGRLDIDIARRSAFAFFALALVLAWVVARWVGLEVLLLTLVGCLAGYFYTAPPLHYKYRGLGAVGVFFLMGPLMVVGAHYALTGTWSALAGMAAVPVGCLVTAILYANEVRDLEDDANANIRTLPQMLGEPAARRLYVILLVTAFAWLVAATLLGWLPLTALLPLLTAPQAVRLSGTMLRQPLRQMASIDQSTAQLHLTFGLLLALGTGLGIFI